MGGPDLSIDAPAVAARIEDFLRRQLDVFRRDGAVIGISGGIDSSVVASLLVRALGPRARAGARPARA